MLQHPYYFSGDAQESIISNDELDEINKIDGIKSLNDYIEINLLSGGHESFEQMDRGEIPELNFIIDNGNKKKKVTGDTLSGRISLVSYQDVNEKQLKINLIKMVYIYQKN